MSAEQERLILVVLRSGWICGLSHPYDALINYSSILSKLVSKDDAKIQEQKIYDAFVEFFKDSDKEILDANSLKKMVMAWQERTWGLRTSLEHDIRALTKEPDINLQNKILNELKLILAIK